MIILDQLFTDFPLPAHQLRMLMLTAPNRYKFFYIKKRSGGDRLISQPAKEVKWLQRYVVEKLRPKLFVHECATAYEPSSSILVNAKTHVRNRFLLKMDFQNFFPSITAEDVASLIKSSYSEMGDDELQLLVRLFVMQKPKSHDLILAAGAPSSPFISNAIMYEFDADLNAHCQALGISYTRYADDIALSTDTPLILGEVYGFVKTLVQNSRRPILKINEDKTVFTSKKHNRKVTGLTLTSTNEVSLGRDMKRKLRAAVDKFRKGELELDAVSILRGRLSFALAVEPLFVQRLRIHYGEELIARLFHG